MRVRKRPRFAIALRVASFSERGIAESLFLLLSVRCSVFGVFACAHAPLLMYYSVFFKVRNENYGPGARAGGHSFAVELQRGYRMIRSPTLLRGDGLLRGCPKHAKTHVHPVDVRAPVD